MGAITGESSIVVALLHAAVLGLELLAVLIIVIGTLYGAAQYLLLLRRQSDRMAGYHRFKLFIGRALLLALEILLAADVIYTVTLEATLQAIAVLGALVLVRTFLTWSLVVELEGRWPWQPERSDHASTLPQT